MGNLKSVDAAPETNTALNSTLKSTNIKDSVNTTTIVTITTSSLLLIVVAVLIVAGCLFWALHKSNLGVLNNRINHLAHLTGFGQHHIVQDIELVERQPIEQNKK